MLLTITTTYQPATDLGYLLHKHPLRVQSFALSFGQAHVFYPETSVERCTAALLLDVDPVQLARGPDEPPDSDLRAFYGRLLRGVADAQSQRGDWRLCECTRCSDDDSHRQLVAWCWSSSDARHLVVVNLSPARATGRVRLPWGDLAGRTWSFADSLSGDCFERSGDDLAAEGLHVALEAWGPHFLIVEAEHL